MKQRLSWVKVGCVWVCVCLCNGELHRVLQWEWHQERNLISISISQLLCGFKSLRSQPNLSSKERAQLLNPGRGSEFAVDLLQAFHYTERWLWNTHGNHQKGSTFKTSSNNTNKTRLHFAFLPECLILVHFAISPLKQHSLSVLPTDTDRFHSSYNEETIVSGTSHGFNLFIGIPRILQSGVCFKVWLQKCKVLLGHVQSLIWRSEHWATCVFQSNGLCKVFASLNYKIWKSSRNTCAR